MAVAFAAALACWPAIAPAISPTFLIDQVYSNFDGSVQFVEIRDTGVFDCDSAEQVWLGQALTSTGPGPTATYVFPANLSTCKTSGRRILIATQSFASLGLVTPDFVIPDHFIQMRNGVLDFAGVSGLAYDALPTDGVTALDRTGKPTANQAVNLAGQSASLSLPGAPAVATAVEYYHAVFDHYFITAIADEIVKLDNGTFAGWARTGESFGVYSAGAAGLADVCRFFSTAFGVKSSHFYTPDATECGIVQANPSWSLEGVVFRVTRAGADGTCASGTRPVYRLYNNGQGGAPNHRYTTSLDVRATMIARGWIPEGYGDVGVIMCSPVATP